ncbi:TlpA disulfide reductase family protein [Mucilaginibacter phyllosphaerae]|uniref:AhpC/TSA family protein n=1 Tax=Mucilaginibacter phyllosphaerae TaxID=1812349 RepID=A0A4Y8AJX1_9SPHI|nr:TlpA disulfide reductase family protein [Mucilaginibacter phyllosphaerae]MBB3968164.1 peroxiredoxin [Mucilaginibacter phyllosphaerae]TEW68821.1 AhpC/TSA family protein [Mucilaginibacter phyllosphaerae]GGH00810.1 thiol:disulfide interchange protein [Mucilaginibacter phyllosphaerae]
MKNRIVTCLAFLAVLMIASCKQATTFTVSGKLENPGSLKKVYLLVADSSQVNVVDSTEINGSNEFTFKHPAPYANLYKLRIAGNIYDLVAKNGDEITFKTDVANTNHDYEVSGSETSEKIKEFNKISNLYGGKNSKLSDEYTAKSAALGKESDSLLKVYMPQFQKNIADYSAEVLKFVNENKKSLAGFYAATSLDQYKYEQQMVAYADEIKDEFKDNPAVQTFLKQMAVIKPISVGHKAPGFTINSINGKQINLADYKGKYVMLDFWASWCGPCRQENPNVVKQYALYKDKGFNILGISLDTEKKDWDEAVKKDRLTWAHASDLQRFEGPTERLYHIEAIPSNFIIDPQGNIVAKNVTGADLEEFLKKTFK